MPTTRAMRRTCEPLKQRFPSDCLTELLSAVVFWRQREKRCILLVGTAMFNQRANEGTDSGNEIDHGFNIQPGG